MSEIIPLGLFRDAYLMTVDPSAPGYPTSKIQKGLVVGCKDRNLSEEGIGFGAPVFKFGEEAIFPGSWRAKIEEHEGSTLVTADYVMNMAARTTRRGRLMKSRFFYRSRNVFSSLHRNHPSLRSGLNLSASISRKVLQLEDTFAEVSPVGSVRAIYAIKDCEIQIDLSFSKSKGCSEIIVMNEQGANHFDTYRDSNGLILHGSDIGCWDEVHAKETSFIDSVDKIAFTLKRVKGARMFRGRELSSKWLAWSGLAYVLPPETDSFAYSIIIDTDMI